MRIKFILYFLVMGLVICSCDTDKDYLTAEQKEFLVYDVGETISLVDYYSNDTITLPCTYKDFDMTSGRCFARQQEYGRNRFFKDSTTVNFMVNADSINFLKFEIYRNDLCYFQCYYSLGQKMDSLNFKGHTFTDVYRFEGKGGKLFLDKKFGIIKITDSQDSIILYKPH